jgi:4-hydroxythreonine-4-phosphate dehydrogenase
MKILGITIGDPNGIGPEVVVKAIFSLKGSKKFIPVIIGNKSVITKAQQISKTPFKIRCVDNIDVYHKDWESIQLIHINKPDKIIKGIATKESGFASVQYIKKAIELAKTGIIHGIVTAPICKEAINKSGFHWEGHTEMLAELTMSSNYAMVFKGGPLMIILATIHKPLKAVPNLITKQVLIKVIKLAKKTCDMFRIKEPKIAVAGLNPHAGENGLFGDEEINIIKPAILTCRHEGINVSGPYPPDTVFHMAYKRKFDIVVCMYHDQGLIPLKMIAFDKGVNITVGLPFIRTSPDHGTAYDIAWKGIANPSSMIEAIKTASRLIIK